MKAASKRICIVIPAYNEGTVIGEVLDGLPTTVKNGKHSATFDTVVVNDGSRDNTADEVLQRPRIKLVNHIMNSGPGAATRTGLSYAREYGYDYAITMDADGQHHTDDVIKLAKAIMEDKADLIIGSRFFDTTGMPKRRIIGTRGLNFITFLLFGAWVSDVQSGMKAFNKRAIAVMRYRSNFFAFCSEIVWVAHRNRLRIAEVPIKVIYTEYSLAKGQLGQSDITAGLRFVRQMIKQRLMSFIDG
jgi:glycosyltransferase involved in cell wall biosynthesis